MCSLSSLATGFENICQTSGGDCSNVDDSATIPPLVLSLLAQHENDALFWILVGPASPPMRVSLFLLIVHFDVSHRNLLLLHDASLRNQIDALLWKVYHSSMLFEEFYRFPWWNRKGSLGQLMTFRHLHKKNPRGEHGLAVFSGPLMRPININFIYTSRLDSIHISLVNVVSGILNKIHCNNRF